VVSIAVNRTGIYIFLQRQTTKIGSVYNIGMLLFFIGVSPLPRSCTITSRFSCGINSPFPYCFTSLFPYCFMSSFPHMVSALHFHTVSPPVSIASKLAATSWHEELEMEGSLYWWGSLITSASPQTSILSLQMWSIIHKTGSSLTITPPLSLSQIECVTSCVQLSAEGTRRYNS